MDEYLYNYDPFRMEILVISEKQFNAFNQMIRDIRKMDDEEFKRFIDVLTGMRARK